MHIMYPIVYKSVHCYKREATSYYWQELKDLQLVLVIVCTYALLQGDVTIYSECILHNDNSLMPS